MTDPLSELDSISLQFGEAYELFKETEELKKELQPQLFDALTRQEAKKRLPRRRVDIPEGWVTHEYVASRFPGWIIIDTDCIDDEGINALIERDPALTKATHINLADGKVYGRDEVEAAPSLDAGRLAQEDPELLEAITRWPEPFYTMVRELVSHQKTPDGALTADEIERITARHLEKHGIKREPIPLKDLSEEIRSRVQPYLLPGKLSVKLRPVREAKPEEIAEERARREDDRTEDHE